MANGNKIGATDCLYLIEFYFKTISTQLKTLEFDSNVAALTRFAIQSQICIIIDRNRATYHRTRLNYNERMNEWRLFPTAEIPQPFLLYYITF